jgi:ABC-type sugar transport system substrate-binding protein
MKKLLSLLMVATLTLTCAFAQGGSETQAKTAAAGSKKIGLVADQLFESRIPELDGVKAEAKKHGYEVIETVADGDAQTQNSQIETLITQKVEAIVVCAVDQNTVETALLKASMAGIPIVAFDRNLPDSEAMDAFVGLDSLSDGAECGKYIAEKAKNYDGEYVVLELLGALNDQNGIDRAKGFEDVLANVSNVRIIKSPTDWDSQKALQATQDAFSSDPSIKAVYCGTDTQIPSVETVLNEIGKSAKYGEPGHIVVLGINGSKAGYDATVSGVADGIVSINMFQVGVEAAKTAFDLIDGKSVTKSRGVPGVLYTTETIEANKDLIWGVN